ncbi:MAG TPA: 5,6-dimethylbenzimidazole synthase [Candidatus Acidoferrales bacterium]|jgi:5,6-dimethylbenzimidazole synthase|nr:5,6-dimethylbenzimidazole synthase [Candidatus Acidoferrales bacterium]
MIERQKKSAVSEFSRTEKRGLYKAIYGRRDVRGHFLSDPIADRTLRKLLDSAHHAGSVGFMQPWSFIVIRSREVKKEVKGLFEQANAAATKVFKGQKRQLYSRLKLEGILEAPVNLCVTCDPSRNGPNVLGRNTIRQTDVYSTCCAVQNLWLAARSEGIGVGWVSIFDPTELKSVLNIPEPVIPVAYLCLGYVREFLERPELEILGWMPRIPLDELIFFERWGQKNGN